MGQVFPFAKAFVSIHALTKIVLCILRRITILDRLALSECRPVGTPRRIQQKPRTLRSPQLLGNFGDRRRCVGGNADLHYTKKSDHSGGAKLLVGFP